MIYLIAFLPLGKKSDEEPELSVLFRSVKVGIWNEWLNMSNIRREGIDGK